MMITLWIAASLASFAMVGYSADRIGLPGYGSDIPFSWLWTPVYVASLLLFFVSAFCLLVRIFP